MALCGDAAGWARRGASGDAARAQRFQDHVKTDRKDARGIAELMRLGWFRPLHCKSREAARHADRAQIGAEGAYGN
jgi:hypothetical protein